MHIHTYFCDSCDDHLPEASHDCHTTWLDLQGGGNTNNIDTQLKQTEGGGRVIEKEGGREHTLYTHTHTHTVHTPFACCPVWNGDSEPVSEAVSERSGGGARPVDPAQRLSEPALRGIRAVS